MKIVSRLILLVLLFLMGLFLGNVHADSEVQVTGIHKASFEGDLAQIKSLLKKDPQLLETGAEEDKKPMHWAAQGGHQEVVEYLLQQGAKINSVDNDNDTPLHYATGHGHLELIKYLISKGADMNAKSNYGTPAFVASRFKRLEILKYYIKKGADLSYTEENGFGILHYWGFGDSTEIIEMLIDSGIPVDTKTKDGTTPFMCAVLRGNFDIVKLFINKGADVNATSEDNWHPLFLAVREGNKKIVPLLLKAGSSIDFRNKDTMQTPLHMAALMGYGEIAGMLIEKGADLDAKDSLGHTPLYYACRYGNKSAAKALITKGSKWTEEAKKEKEMNNFEFSPLLKKDFKPGSAVTWYLGHSGFAVKTTSHLLIFDYFEYPNIPDNLLLANGSINPQELKDLNVTVFVSHSHRDHFMPGIFDWKKDIKNITYIMGFKPEDQTGYTYIEPRQTKKMNGMEITTIESNDSGVGFLVRVDGVTIFHSGDHANRHQDFSGPFKQEIDFLAEKNLKPDIFFAPVSGCGFGDQEAVKKGVYYTAKKLSPKIIVPMHAGRGEENLFKFAEKAKESGVKTPICCSRNKGDWFFVHQGQVKKSRFMVFDNECQVSKENKKNETTCCRKIKKSCKKK